MKEMIKCIGVGLGVACMIFCAVGVCFDQLNGGTFALTNYMFTKMAVGTAVIGIGWGAPAALFYSNEKQPLPWQIVTHLVIGMAVMTATSYIVGWIPVSSGLGACIAAICGQIACALLVYLGFYLHNRKLAGKINERLREMDASKRQ